MANASPCVNAWPCATFLKFDYLIGSSKRKMLLKANPITENTKSHHRTPSDDRRTNWRLPCLHWDQPQNGPFCLDVEDDLEAKTTKRLICWIEDQLHFEIVTKRQKSESSSNWLFRQKTWHQPQYVLFKWVRPLFLLNSLDVEQH